MPRTRSVRKRYHLLPGERLGEYQEPTTPDVERGIRKLISATVILALQDAAVENPPHRMADAYGWLQGRGRSWLQHLDIEYDDLDSVIERVRLREVYGIFPSHVKSQE